MRTSPLGAPRSSLGTLSCLRVMMFSCVDPQVVDSAKRPVTLLAFKTPGATVLAFYVPLQAPVVAEILVARVALEVSAHIEALEPAL